MALITTFVRTRLQLKLQHAKRMSLKSPRLDWKLLTDDGHRQEFHLVLLNHFALLDDPDNVDEVVCRMIKRDHEAYWDQVAEDPEQALSRHEYYRLYCTLRCLSGKSQPMTTSRKLIVPSCAQQLNACIVGMNYLMAST